MSYAYTEIFSMRDGINDALSAFNAPSKTVMLCEVGEIDNTGLYGHNVADLSTTNEAGGDVDATGLRSYSPVSNGIGASNRALMSTGYLGSPDRIASNGPHEFDSPTGRHSIGANTLLADGHVKHLRSTQISTGIFEEGCLVTPTTPEGRYCSETPAGTESPEGWAATYSPI